MRVTGVKRNENLTTITVQATQTKKPQILNVFIIDASGSMRGPKYDNAIEGVNELLNNIKQDQFSDNQTMVVEFEGYSILTTLELTGKLPEYYKAKGTGGTTPLNQAVGETLETIVSLRENKFDVNDKILINVFTDGDENSSNGKWGGRQGAEKLGQYIKELEPRGVTVTFMGTQNEVNYAINKLNLKSSNTLVHDNTSRGIKMSFEKTVLARSAYSKSVSLGEDVKESFYTKTIETNNK